VGFIEGTLHETDFSEPSVGGVSLINVEFWLTPWARTDEHLPMSHLAEVTHDRGFLWDSVSFAEVGSEPIEILWLRSIDANSRHPGRG
jgi:hypothetical protein